MALKSEKYDDQVSKNILKCFGKCSFVIRSHSVLSRLFIVNHTVVLRNVNFMISEITLCFSLFNRAADV